MLVLHEHCLHHLVVWRTLGRGDEEGYWKEMFYAYGRLGARTGRDAFASDLERVPAVSDAAQPPA
jgi:hypothetical protein